MCPDIAHSSFIIQSFVASLTYLLTSIGQPYCQVRVITLFSEFGIHMGESS